MVSLDASAVPLEDAVAPPLELSACASAVSTSGKHRSCHCQCHIINSARTFMLRFFILFTSLRFRSCLMSSLYTKIKEKQCLFCFGVLFVLCWLNCSFYSFNAPLFCSFSHIRFATSALFRHYDDYLCYFPSFDIFRSLSSLCAMMNIVSISGGFLL